MSQKHKTDNGITRSKPAETIADWLDQAVSQMIYKPDRELARQELQNHFEDHTDALIAAGYSRHIAENKALEALGDPIQAGKQLNLAHKPWLGLLWIFTKWFFIPVTIVYMLLCFVISQGFGGYPDPNYYHRYMEGNFDIQQKLDAGYTVKQAFAEDSVKFGANELSLEMGNHSYGPGLNENIDHSSGYTSILLKVRTPLFSDLPEIMHDGLSLTITDSAGFQYHKGWNWDVIVSGDNNLSPCVSTWLRGRYFFTHYVMITLYDGAEDIDWIDINYNEPGAQFTFHVDFNPVDESTVIPGGE